MGMLLYFIIASGVGVISMRVFPEASWKRRLYNAFCWPYLFGAWLVRHTHQDEWDD